MSWFDTGGIATLAKSALKDMQKHIDKALDIKEEEIASRGKSDQNTPDTPSIDEPNKSLAAQQDSVWGSFTGSFFDTPQPTPETVTSAPRKQLSKASSESLEVISPPITPHTPASTLSMTSPAVSSSIALGSESVEIIGTTPSIEETPTSLDLFSPDSVFSDSMKSPESVEIILEDEFREDISVEDDSMSYNTVSDAPITMFEPQGKVMNRQNLHLLLTTTTTNLAPFSSSESMVNSSDSEQTIVSDKRSEGALESFEYQTQISSSTQSFEEISSQHHSDMELSVKVSDERRTKPMASTFDTRLRDQHSPNSSDGKSDVELVKIGTSDQTSGQTSGDEIETTTSSDIEIISSPNGDSSSTNSVPVKNFHKNLTALDMLQVVKKKGHCRENSEISVQSNASDDSSNQSETEKLLRRISDLGEILEQREYKLVEIGRQNAELQDRNQEILSQLEAKQKQSDSLEVTNVTEEYTQRLSALEKKFQQSIREREVLRKQMNALKIELTAKINKSEADSIIAEKDAIVDELKVEGEKLSKQVLQLSSIIKKLRAKEKETDVTLKRQKETIEEQTEEAERLKKSLTAKEDVERSQIDAVHRLSSDKRRLEKENLQIKSQLEDITQKLETLQTSFDVAKRELTEKKNIHTDLTKQTEAYSTLETDKQRVMVENELLLQQVDELRQKLRQMEMATVTREQNLRRENTELLRKLQEAEMRGEDQQTEITMATIPLVRQLESLQSTLNARTSKFERQEKELLDKLETAQSKLDAQNDHETESKEKIFNLNQTIASLEDKLQTALMRAEQTTNQLQQRQLEHELQESERRNEAMRHQQTEVAFKECQQLIHKDLQETLTKERELFDIERKKLLQEVKKAKEVINDNAEDRDGSPTLSLGGRSSLNDSLTSNNWQMDDLDCVSNSGRLIGSSYPQSQHQNLTATSVMENLQSTLKQRDGEIQQLQWELSRLQGDKNYLTEQLGQMISELDTIRDTLAGHEQAMKEFVSLQEQHDAILQLYGETLEENEELKLDLMESKEAYRTQIDELLQQKREGKL